MDFEGFKQPPSIYRPAPFWAINDRITPEETARQMIDMLRVGLGGGFFHSRAGLVTDYLGDEWFAAMDATLEACKQHDGYLWLYDEDLWPSGNAGGQVAGMKDEYRAALLTAELLFPGEHPSEEPDSIPKASYAIVREGMNLKQARKIEYEEACTDTSGERLVIRRVYAMKTGWWGGESYANLLNAEAMQEFMKLTHEVYRKKYGDEFGKRVPGIFTDEPQVGEHGRRMPWDEALPVNYNNWTGRDFWNDLPFMYFDGEECRRVRLLLHRTILDQFCQSFSEPIFKWCEKHGIAHTGHYNAEDNLVDQVNNHCGGIMAHYRYQQIPGIDHLCRQTENLMLAVKQVSSAARQLGHERVLTEIFGVTGHTNTYADFKWIGDFDLVLGANLFCPHLTLYSAKGRSKRDYPPNWNYQQTYWNDLRPLNDYFSRLSYILSQGKSAANVLVLHPIEGSTAGHRYALKSTHAIPGADYDTIHKANSGLWRTLQAILWSGIDCDLGDENYIEDMATVKNGRIALGKMKYDVVIVPPVASWRPATEQLLEDFAEAGGRILFVGDMPNELDAEPAPSVWKHLMDISQAPSVPCALVQIQAALDKIHDAPYVLRDTDGKIVERTYVQHRIDGDREVFFIVNSNRNDARRYVFTLKDAASKPLAIWNPLDGSRCLADVTTVGDDLRYEFELPPAGSILLVAGDDAKLPAEERLPELSKGKIVPLPEAWDIGLSEDNVLVMDKISFSLDGGKSWSDEDMEFRVRSRLAQYFGTSDALAWQPWVAARKKLFDGKGGEVILRYRFESSLDSVERAFIVIEDLTKGAVAVNGQPVDISKADWHWDHSFGKVDIAKLVRKGENIVDFTVNYNYLTVVEPAYVVGDFGVYLNLSQTAGVISKSRDRLLSGSWLEQGFPFYSGVMTYSATVQKPSAGRIFLRLNNASGILFKVRVNGKNAGNIYWPPHVIEVTDLLQDGDNTVEIDVVSSRQNSLGPLHLRRGDDEQWIGPNAFEDENLVRTQFSLFDYGLLCGAEFVCLTA